MTVPTIIIGAGGHGRVLADLVKALGQDIVGFLDPDPALRGVWLNGIPVLGNDDLLINYSPESFNLTNGVGSTSSTSLRARIYERLTAANYKFQILSHPSAILAPSCSLAYGTQIMAGAVVQTGSKIGENTIVNTGAILDHDCVIGKHCHIAPGAVLSGSVHLGDICHVGTGASVIQGIRIGKGSLVAAGAVVIQDVPPNVTVAGVPARIVDKT